MLGRSRIRSCQPRIGSSAVTDTLGVGKKKNIGRYRLLRKCLRFFFLKTIYARVSFLFWSDM
jgi:hypothetical protein